MEIRMVVGAVQIKLYAPWVHSLKEKRMIVKSMIAKLRNHFNISVIESENQDLHQTVGIAFSFICQNQQLADSTIDSVLGWIEAHSEAEITEIEKEFY